MPEKINLRGFYFLLFIVLVNVFRGSRPLSVDSIAFRPVVRKNITHGDGNSWWRELYRKSESKKPRLRKREERKNGLGTIVSFSGMSFNKAWPPKVASLLSRAGN